MKLTKKQCEVCGDKRKYILHIHHIIPRCDIRCTNHISNLAVVCPTCHSEIHAGQIIIIGVYSSTNGRQLMWFKKGAEAPLPKEFWRIKDNPHVITLNAIKDEENE